MIKTLLLLFVGISFRAKNHFLSVVVMSRERNRTQYNGKTKPRMLGRMVYFVVLEKISLFFEKKKKKNTEHISR